MPGPEPGPFPPESSRVTTRPPRLPEMDVIIINNLLNPLYWILSILLGFSVFRLMFWTDWSFHNPKIERASLAGLDRIVLVDLQNSSQYWPNGIFIDYTEDRVYWIDAWIDTIDSCDLNGNNRRQVASPVHPIFNMHPFDFTVYDDILYWSDWNTDSIETLNWTTAAYKGSLGILTSDRVFGVALLDNSRQPASAGKQIKIKQIVSWLSIIRTLVFKKHPRINSNYFRNPQTQENCEIS